MMNKHITLCKPGRVPVCVLNGIDTSTINYTQKFNDLDEITFTVDKYIEAENGKRIFSAGYEKLHAFMEVYVDDIGYFQIKEPEISNEINKETKAVTGVSIATELLQKDLVGFTVNTSTTSSLEMLAENNINSLGYPNEYITFYNPTNKQLSLLDLVLEKAIGWSVGEVDDFLKNQRYSFDNINESIFSFLTKTLSSTARCIFKFDTMNKTVSAYSENHIGNDTGIVIAERNLLNSVDIQCDSDNIYTRLNVQGKDSLNFADINYGDTHVFNLDYYSNLDYMSQDLIDALGMWQNARNDGRDEYISKVKTYQSYLEQISEIDNKVPTNGVLNNWDNMSMDELNKNLTYYNSLIKELQIVAQNTHPKTGETEYVGSLDDYSPSRLKPDGTVDHDSYINDLDGQGKETYREIIAYVIPNIEIAIENFDLAKDDKKDYFEDYLTDWDLYGLVELKAKQSSYEDQIGTLKAYQKGWNELTKEEKTSHGDNEVTYTQYHDEYEKLDGYLVAIKNKTTELQDKKDKLVSGRDSISKELSTIRSNMSIDGGRDVDGSFVKWFTEEQLITINLLFHDTDYTNENILITKLNDFSSKLDIEKELYADAEKELSELSVPQYTFSCSLDNLLSMDEFSFWHNDFKVGNFITLEINKGSFSSYKIDGIFIKLRLISISYNPFIKTNDLTVEFSNMITGKDGRNDFSYIFDKAISTAKNSITLSNNNNAKDDVELSIELLNLLSNSSVFQGKFDNLNLKSAVINEAAIVNLIADFAKITELDAKYATIENLNAANATITELNANVANIEKAYIKKIDADEIYAKTADVDTLLAGYVKSDVASIGTLFNKVGLIDRATIVDGHITGFLDAVEINANNITAGTLVADRILLKAPEGSDQKGLLYAINKFGNVESTSVDTIDGNLLTNRTITADKLIANSITANELDVADIFGNNAVLTTLVSQDIFANAISSNTVVASANANALEALNQKIGGRNIARGTAVMTPGANYTGNWNDGTWKSNKSWGVLSVVDITDSPVEGATKAIRLTANKVENGCGVSQQLTPLVAGQQYVLSCWVRGTAPMVQISTYYSTQVKGKIAPFNITSQWQKVFVDCGNTEQYNAPTETKPYSASIVYIVPKNIGDYVEICGLKLEKGNKPTDWSPAPEDVDAAISEASIANWCYNNDTTYINGGKIYTGTVTADKLTVSTLSAITANLGTVTAGTLQSDNYVKTSGHEGMKLSLSDGSWDSKNFKIDTTGNITATGGILGGWDFDGKIMKKLLVDGTTDAEKRYVFINTKVTIGSWEGTTLTSPKGRVLGINAAIDENIGTQTVSGTAGALYVNADGSISATSSDKKATFEMSNGSICLNQTKVLAGENETTYRCLAQGNVLTFCKPDAAGKYPKNGYMYIGEVANEVVGSVGFRGVKGIFSDTEDLYVATGGEINLNATAINITGILNGSLNGNASTATKLETARAISLTGSVTGSGKFDGSGNLSISTETNHTHPYLPLTGGTVTGEISRKSVSAVNTYYWVERTDLTFTDISKTSQHEDIRFGIASSGRRGIWDRRYNSWLTYFPPNSTTPISKGAFAVSEGTITINGTTETFSGKISFTEGRNYMYIYTNRIPRLYNKIQLTNGASKYLVTDNSVSFGYEITNTASEKYIRFKVKYSGSGTPTNPSYSYIVFFCSL